MSDKEEVITLRGDDGLEHSCQVVGMFEFEDREYALVLNLGEVGGPAVADPEGVLMRVETQDGQSTFHMIEDNLEFERVSAFVQESAAELEKENGSDEDE